MSQSDNRYFQVSCLITIICYILSAYIDFNKEDFKNELNKHGFDRALIISVEEKSPGVLSSNDTARLMSSPPVLSNGPLAVLSRDSANHLLALPEVGHAMAITRVEQKLTFQRFQAGEVSVFHVPPQFIEEFHLGSSSSLQKGVYIPSSTFLKKIQPTNSALMPATIGIADNLVQMLAGGLDIKLDFSKYRAPIILSSEAFNLPGGSSAFDNTLFTTGEPIKFSLPGGIHIFEKIWLVVKLKDGINTDSGMKTLTKFFLGANNLYGENSLKVTPMTNYFAKQLSLDYLSSWAARLRYGIFMISILLLFMLVLTRHTRVRHEVALRRAMGVSSFKAGWLSSKRTVIGIMGGIALGSTVAFITCTLIKKSLLASMLPIFTFVGMIGILAVVVLIGSSMLTARNDIFTQLKGEW